MIFGIDSYFKGINIAFISVKQLYKDAEGLENHYQLKGNRGSLSVQYQLKTSFTHSMLGSNTHLRWGGHSGKGLTPLLIQFWLWEEIVSCAGECLDSSEKYRKGKAPFSHFANRKLMVINIIPITPLNSCTWRERSCEGLSCCWPREVGISEDYFPLTHPPECQNSSLQVPPPLGSVLQTGLPFH